MVKSRLMPVAAAALFDGAGRVLLQRRPAGTTLAGLWEFPGGKVEEAESPEAALVRELHEELGIIVDAGALEPASFATLPLGERHLVLLLYLVRAWTGTPEPRAADALVWVTTAEAEALPMPTADVPLVNALRRLT